MRDQRQPVCGKPGPAPAALTLWLGLTAGCGAGSGSSSASGTEDTAVRRIMAIAMGGNDSCSHSSGHSPASVSLLPNLSAMLERTADAPSKAVGLFVVCWTLAREIYTAESANAPRGQRADRGDVADRIGAAYRAWAPDQVLLVGHSYGGWLAMQTLLALPFTADLLMTIDPISPIKCQLRNLRGCNSAPTDIPPPAYARLRERSDYWLHAYATKAPLLHSGPVPAADANHGIATSHHHIDNRDDVWRLAEAALRGRLAGDTNGARTANADAG